MSTTDSGIATGLNKGYIVTKREKRARPSRRKGRLNPKVALIRQVVRSVAGFAPYEKRVIDLLKAGGQNPQKRAWRFAKKRLGTHRRAKAKVAEMSGVMQGQSQAAAKDKADAKAAGKK